MSNYIISAHGEINFNVCFRLPRNVRVIAFCRQATLCLKDYSLFFTDLDDDLKNFNLIATQSTPHMWTRAPLYCIWDGAYDDIAMMVDYNFTPDDNFISGILEIPLQVNDSKGYRLDYTFLKET